MEIFFVAVLLGLLPGYIAYRKGHSFVSYWAFGALLFIVALPVSIFMQPDQEELDERRLKKTLEPPQTGNAPLLADQLGKLQALYDSGALTQTEYERAKQRTLADS